jgi:DNA helicase-2/ATP-dependent DNA helicase PcrA
MPHLKELNNIQREAVECVNGPVMVIAGAGSGKTRLLTYRIAHLVHCGVPAYQVLALTFTNKAANEMKERAERLINRPINDLWIGTFHSLFARLLRREAQALNLSSSFTIYDSEDSLTAIKHCMKSLKIDTDAFEPRTIRAAISKSKNNMKSAEEYNRIATTSNEIVIGQVFRKYEEVLRSSSALDFDDLLIKPIELFTRHPQVLKKYQDWFKYLLIDEFQDTNHAQYEVVRLLSAKHRNICVVGDDAQSIYSFRGADIRNILDFSKDYPDSKTFRLEQNYRSTKAIIETANALIQENTQRLHKIVWTENPVGEQVHVIEASSDRDEASRIVTHIRNETQENKYDLKNFAILYRTNAQSRVFEDLLGRHSLPYVIVGGTRFYERKEIKDILAYLRLILNPLDRESLLRSINNPPRGIGDTSMEKILRHADQHSLPLYETLRGVDRIDGLPERARLGVHYFTGLIEKFSFLRKDISISEFVRSLVDEVGFLRLYKAEDSIESLTRIENIQELFVAVKEFSSDTENGTLETFLEQVALVSDIDGWEDQRNAITLMTLHSSKGLEFPVVFITGIEDGILPHSSNIVTSEGLEEERRLFYVGITRAQKKLYLSHARERSRFGETSRQLKSKFLEEIGDEHLFHERAPKLAETIPQKFSFSHPKTVVAGKTESHFADQYFSDSAPNYEDESQETFQIRPGSRVIHETFGRGKVVDVNGKGNEKKAVVQFKSVGVKTLMLKWAHLKQG